MTTERELAEVLAVEQALYEVGNASHRLRSAGLPYEQLVKAHAALTALLSRADGGEDCHCATCSCKPGMTMAVRYDLSPAEHEGRIRDHLVSLGWTPPASKEPDERN